MAEDLSEKIATFKAIAGTEDDGFALSFLEEHNWNLEVAVNSFVGGGVGGAPNTGAHSSGVGGPGAGVGGVGGVDADGVREALPQYREQLMDPSYRMPAPAEGPLHHPLEAFRDFRAERQAREEGDDDDEGGSYRDRKRPRNLAEIYRAPTEMCFKGSFEQLRSEGKQHGRWLLINIQSPTEFASQQLNADTWTDESLRAVVAASFLFWQQYFDSELGSTYCRHYLPTPPSLPHIGIIDPVTGQLVKSWNGFKSVEVLMDKLTEYADEPPCAYEIDADVPPAALSPLASASSRTAPPPDDDAELKAAIAASLAAGVDVPEASADEEPASPPGFDEKPWDPPPDEPDASGTDVITLAVRLPNNGRLQRRFLQSHTFQDVLCSVHHSGAMALSTARKPCQQAKAYQLASHGVTTATSTSLTLRDIGLSGRVMVNVSERD